ncbi:MAG: glutamine-hydrolyzing carbamoyl-phosphate synthase small subunit [Melioribacteraceae bacterium]|nr:glutamine-hydrolyzing carbamoyl-phosphate synthase small subunit [Melioribacteraceae bacterium]
MDKKKLKLVLEDGAEYTGYAFGYYGFTEGEVVFNTGMVGYPETMTDPSYCGQILVCTYPLIGNYGIPPKDIEHEVLRNFESDHIQVKALIISDYSHNHSHWQAEKSLGAWMEEEKIPGIYGIDTRSLTRKLREKGTMLGRIVSENEKIYNSIDDPNERNLAAEVCMDEPKLYKKGDKKIVLVDCGVKNNIIRAFLGRNISVLRVPHDYDFMNEDCNGIMISNGPGDPKKCISTIGNTRRAMEQNIPILGICLGCQILALASGADTYKLKYGHRSHNQPVNETGTRRCYITSQNHGYAINSDTLSLDWREWFINDNDGTNEGIIHISKPFFGAQFHPEASPGPDDTEFIFDMFVRALK